MVAAAALVTTVVLTLLLFVLLEQLAFLRPYKEHLWRSHRSFLILYVSLLAVNVFAGALVLVRKIGLKATGQKLAHLDHELHGQATGHDDGEDAEE